MSPDEGQEELEEVQAELKKKDEEVSMAVLIPGPGKHSAKIRHHQRFSVAIPSRVMCVGHEKSNVVPGVRS